MHSPGDPTPTTTDPADRPLPFDGAESAWDPALVHLLAETLAGRRRRALH